MRVLFADDDCLTRQVVCKTLADEGWEVIEAKDGKEAWEKFQQTSPDVVVLDIDMPHYDGLEVIQLIQSIDLHTPIILYSSFMSDEEVKKREKVNFQFHLLKSFDPSQLIYVIRQLYKPQEARVYHLAEDVSFDPFSLELNKRGKTTDLSSNITGKILQALCSNMNRLTTRDALLEIGWGSTQNNLEPQLNKIISKIKQLLRDVKNVSIQTDPRRGYWLKVGPE